mgnify:CR=1 FL=1
MSGDIAIVGVTGLEGESLLDVLEDEGYPFASIHLIEPTEQAGERLMLRGQSQRVEALERFDFASVKVVIFLGSSKLAADWAPVVAAKGCVVVDSTGAHRGQPDVPVVVADVNPQRIADFAARRIVASPDAQVVQTASALKPLLDEAGLRSVTLATYQSMSTHSRDAVEALAFQTGRLLNGQPAEKGVLDRQAAFNLLPRIGELDESGAADAERVLAEDLRRVLELPDLPVSATCVLVPLFFGTAQSLQAMTQQVVAPKRLAGLLRKGPGLKLLDKPAAGGYPTPVSDATGSDHIWIGRLRQDALDAHSINMWVVSDNLRKGVVLNSLAIAARLIKDFL